MSAFVKIRATEQVAINKLGQENSCKFVKFVGK